MQLLNIHGAERAPSVEYRVLIAIRRFDQCIDA